MGKQNLIEITKILLTSRKQGNGPFQKHKLIRRRVIVRMLTKNRILFYVNINNDHT